MGHAHGAMHEDFDGHAALGADFGNFLETQFAGRIDAHSPQSFPELNGSQAGGIGLGADMNRNRGGDFPCQDENGGVGDDHPVGPDGRQFPEKTADACKVAVARVDIAGDISLDVAVMAIGNGGCQFIPAEITGVASQVEFVTAQINGIGTEMNRGFKLFKITRRRQKFDPGGRDIAVQRSESPHLKLQRTRPALGPPRLLFFSTTRLVAVDGGVQRQQGREVFSEGSSICYPSDACNVLTLKASALS